jgi:drug/metabolite transporter (DMT)-like permease
MVWDEDGPMPILNNSKTERNICAVYTRLLRPLVVSSQKQAQNRHGAGVKALLSQPMIALLFGLFAALCWSAHDLLARRFAAEIGALRMAICTLLAGASLLLVWVLWHGNLKQADLPTLLLSVELGVVYGLAIGGLFKAYRLAPVSIVGPFTAGYPALVVLWGIYQGLQPGLWQILAILTILIGAVIVGRMGPSDGGLVSISRSHVLPLMAFCVLAIVCFAASVVLGQKLAGHVGVIEATFLSRFPAALVLLPMLRGERPEEQKISPAGWSGIFAMGAFDVAAVSAINYMGVLPNKEYGAMGISAYGAIAALLGVIFLKEKTTPAQWAGVFLICIGVGVLGIA